MTQPQSDESSDEEDADNYCEDNPKTDNTGLSTNAGLSLFLFAFFKIVLRVNQLESFGSFGVFELSWQSSGALNFAWWVTSETPSVESPF